MPFTVRKTVSNHTKPGKHLFGSFARFIFLTDDVRTPYPAEIIDRLPPGCAVIVRHRDTKMRRLWYQQLRPRCQRRQIDCVISCENPKRVPPGALIHIPIKSAHCWRQTDIMRYQAQIYSCSAHSLKEIQRSARLNAPHLLLSPVLPTRSHLGQQHLGFMRFSRLAQQTDMAVFALGGMSERYFPRILKNDGVGIAGISNFLSME